ncbi:hypothetical protein L7F22_000374 [Adiantum nelumboides]|nr:hypothetical protein [Adiantum nelumboides]
MRLTVDIDPQGVILSDVFAMTYLLVSKVLFDRQTLDQRQFLLSRSGFGIASWPYLVGHTDLAKKIEQCLSRDADFAGHPDCRKSTSGYVFTFTGGAVSWISRLQKCVALSTTEAEYVAATEASKEALWLMRLVEEVGIKSQVPVLHCDSQSAIMLARNPVFHAKTKHIEVKYHFIRSVLDDKSITLVKVHTDDNPADLLTKSLPAERFAYCRQMMGIG